MKKHTRAQMVGLAAHLYNKRKHILKRWREATEDAPGVTIASSLTRVQFNDHIPGVLDSYKRILLAWPAPPTARSKKDEKKQIIEHGLQRWQQGYQLRDLTREWGHLHMSVMEELDHYELANPTLETSVITGARHAWSQLCWDGISDSSTQYWHLNQAEATGHVRDLEQAMEILSKLDQTRAAAWRETAHDLQGGLGLVTLASSVLDRDDLSKPARLEFSDLVQRGVSSLRAMLNDFMSLARLDAGLEKRNVTTFDAAALMIDFCTTSQPLAQAQGLYLKMDGPDTMAVEGDSTKVQRILQNLLLNALKYTERGGVTVTWNAVSDSLTDNWMFCIQDTGPGLHEDPDAAPLAHKIHESTQTAQEAEDSHPEDKTSADPAKAPTQPSRSDTLPDSLTPSEGVGLSIVKRLCELLDASLDLETSPGKGSTFRIILPRFYADSEKT